MVKKCNGKIEYEKIIWNKMKDENERVATGILKERKKLNKD